MVETNILLESGTNEVEIVKFSIGNESFGINVAKIREIIKPIRPNSIPHQHPAMKGLFEYRENVVPFINLGEAIDIEQKDTTLDKKRMIIANFNQNYYGFLVDEVDKIYRISWQKIEKPPAEITMYGLDKNVVTGVIKLDNQLVMMLDYEYIIADINPNAGFTKKSIREATDIMKGIDVSDISLLIAEDSKLLQQLIISVLNKSGFKQILIANDGKEALAFLESKRSEFQEGKNPIHLLITDIEMPQMDGHSLIKQIRKDDDFKHLPIIIFSSLIDDMMRRKGELLGADAQITKPEVEKLVSLIKQVLKLGE